jgi:hypothetical protein
LFQMLTDWLFGIDELAVKNILLFLFTELSFGSLNLVASEISFAKEGSVVFVWIDLSRDLFKSTV